MNKIRPGMWVLHGKQIAIVAGLTAVAAEIHYVDELGLTVGHNILALEEIKQAPLSAIPLPRRPAIKAGAKLGYV